MSILSKNDNVLVGVVWEEWKNATRCCQWNHFIIFETQWKLLDDALWVHKRMGMLFLVSLSPNDNSLFLFLRYCSSQLNAHRQVLWWWKNATVMAPTETGISFIYCIYLWWYVLCTETWMSWRFNVMASAQIDSFGGIDVNVRFFNNVKLTESFALETPVYPTIYTQYSIRVSVYSIRVNDWSTEHPYTIFERQMIHVYSSQHWSSRSFICIWIVNMIFIMIHGFMIDKWDQWQKEGWMLHCNHICIARTQSVPDVFSKWNMYVRVARVFWYDNRCWHRQQTYIDLQYK